MEDDKNVAVTLRMAKSKLGDEVIADVKAYLDTHLEGALYITT